MRTYETIYITNPTLTDEDDQATLEQFASVVTEAGGSVAVQERMGRRRLAYPIRKMEDGVYHRILYDSETSVPKELDRRLRISDKVLRHLTVYMDPEWAQATKEQAVRDAQARAEAEAAREAALAAGEGASDEGAPSMRVAADEDDSDSDDASEGEGDE